MVSWTAAVVANDVVAGPAVASIGVCPLELRVGVVSAVNHSASKHHFQTSTVTRRKLQQQLDWGFLLALP
jgi:hypothetical protein